VELCATSDGRLVWTETYETPLANTFDVLGPIAAKIIGSLNAEIETAECSRAMLRPPNSLNAWEAHHRGLWHMYRFTGPDNERAQRCISSALSSSIQLSPALMPGFRSPIGRTLFTSSPPTGKGRRIAPSMRPGAAYWRIIVTRRRTGRWDGRSGGVKRMRHRCENLRRPPR